MLEVWETRSSGGKSLTGLKQKNIQYILFKKCTVQKEIRMIGGPNEAVAPVKRQALPYLFSNNFTFQISKTHSDPEGRFIICDLTVGNN